MRNRFFIYPALLIFLLAAATISCDRGVSPMSSELPQSGESQGAVIAGTITSGNSGFSNFSSIQVGIKGTNFITNPNDSGEFSLNNVPAGDVTLEVIIQTTASDINIENVKKNNLVEVVIEVKTGNTTTLVQVRKSNDNGDENEELALALEVHPQRWNTDWAEDKGFSQDEVIAKIGGVGFDRIDFDTLLMTGPEGDEIEPYGYDLGGRYFIAKFYQYEAISIIPEPERGDVHTIQITGMTEEGEAFDLTAGITIVGEKPLGEFSVEIHPDKWNTAWENSEGYIQVMFRGEGFDDIISSSLKMSGPAGDPVFPDNTHLNDNHFHAKFKQKEAISLIPSDAERGDSFTVTLSGEFADGETFSLDYIITIVH